MQVPRYIPGSSLSMRLRLYKVHKKASSKLNLLSGMRPLLTFFFFFF